MSAKPPNLLPTTVMRFYQTGTATPDQNSYETLLQNWFAGIVTKDGGGDLPTSDPHIKGAIWNNLGTLKVSSG